MANLEAIKEAIEDAKEDLLSWDCEPTNENLIRNFNKWIDNLYSHIGDSAHLHLLSLGIADETGLSWAEQDARTLEQIELYKECVNHLKKAR